MTDARTVKQGAVLYDTRGNTSLEPVSDRGLCHVVSVFEEIGTGDRLYNVWDGTHTYQEFVHEDRLLEDFEPAGWAFPRGSKPLYHLTRNCGVEDPADLMTDGGHRLSTDRVDGQMIVQCPTDVEHLEVTIQVEASKEKPSELFFLDECPECGEELDYIEQTQPTEVLE